MKKFLKYQKNIVTVAVLFMGLLSFLGLVALPNDGIASVLGLAVFAGTVASVAGMPDQTVTGSQWIPWMFSRLLVDKFYDKSVMPQIAATKYEGELKKKGDRITFNTIPTAVIGDYSQGQDINWQDITSDPVVAYINRSAYFAVKADKILMHQMLNDMLDSATKDGAEQMRIFIDRQALADIWPSASSDNTGATAGAKYHTYNLGATNSPVPLTKTNIVEILMRGEGVLNEQNMPDSDRFFVLPTPVRNLLDISELRNAEQTGAAKSYLVGGGYFGELGKFKLFESNLYTTVADGSGKTVFPIIFGHKSALCFVNEVIESVYFDKFEKTVGQGMRVVNLYDWKVIKPESLGVVYGYLQ